MRPLTAGPMSHPDAPLPAPAALQDLLRSFLPVSLAETARAALMDRVERKYLTTVTDLCRLLPLLTPHYRALEIGGERLQRYVSVYHDTADFAMYHAHHNGRPRRHKVRTRQYCQTDQTFLELKLRDPTGRTRKERVALTGPASDAVATQPQFLFTHLPVLAHTPLTPTLTVQCERLTLVGRDRTERLTFDLHLTLTSPEEECRLDELVVIELKREGVAGTSPFEVLARQRHLRDGAFSKYGVGCALLYPHLKVNAFKPALLRLAQLARVTRQAVPPAPGAPPERGPAPHLLAPELPG